MKKHFTHLLRLLLCTGVCYITFKASSQDQSFLPELKQYALQRKDQFHIVQKDVESMFVTFSYTDKTTGIQHAYATQKINGLTVTNTSFSLHTLGNAQSATNKLIALSSYKIPSASVTTDAKSAVITLLNAIKYSGTEALTLKQAEKGSDKYTIFSRNNSSIWDVPCRLVYYNDQRLKKLTTAWEIQMMDAYKAHYWLVYIDASTGKIIERKDMIIHCNFGGGITDATANERMLPAPSPEESIANYQQSTEDVGNSIQTLPSNKYRIYNLPYESPIDPGATHQLVTKGGDTLASPDGWHKVGNTITYNYTHGNNVWAFQDPSPTPEGGVPSADPTRTAFPTNTIGGVYPLTEPFVFDYPLYLNTQPPVYQNAAIVNLFFWNNLMHDVSYYFGFDEASGNFQESNTFSTGTRGGATALGADEVWAQAQDGGGTNNANFLTLPDGTNGEMQMYLWTASFPDSLVQFTSSSTGTPAAGSKYIAVQGSFSTLPTDTAANDLYTHPVTNTQYALVAASALSTIGTPTEGCSTGQESIALPSQNVSGKIAVIDRGDCSFVEKVLGAQEGGAVAAIIINNVDGPPAAMGGGDPTTSLVSIPAVMISKADGAALKAQLTNGATVTGSLKRTKAPAPERDGDIDNGVMSHEYTHGISNRLTNGGSLLPLGGDEQGGEGWSDYMALYMTLRNNDLKAPNSSHALGVLPSRGIGNYVTYQAYNALGIREYPYSIDKTVNPATFGYVKRADYAEAHSVGFVWCTMLYEMLQKFIDEYGMNDNVYEGANPTASHNPPATAKGNNIATRLIIEGMKLQPANPTFVEERDAILEADTLLYNGQHSCIIWQAFAKRGLGYSASSGTNALGDEVEAFDVPFSCDPSQKSIRIVKSGAAKVQNGAYVKYTIKVTNLVPKSISSVTVTDTLASTLTFTQANYSPVVKGKIITWTIPLSVGETKVITLTAKLKSSSVSTTVFGDNQENGSSKWSTDASATAKWTYETDSTQANTGSHYWFVPDYDIGGSNTSLKTVNAINIPTGAQLVFIHKYATESGYDGGVIEVSVDNTNWTYLPPTAFSQNGYNGIITTANNPYIGLSDESAFTGTTSGYVTSIASLSDYVGKNIYIRFRMTSDVTGGSVTGGGWWLDDVYIFVNPTQLHNTATAITKAGQPVYLTQGTNAYSTTSSFVTGSTSGFASLIAETKTQHVDLSWQTSTALNNPAFEIERKVAGDNDFKKIGTFSEQGNFDKNYGFTFTDNMPAQSEAEYRVNVADADAAVTTNIVATKLNDAFKASIYPNPAKDVANIVISNPSNKTININLFDVRGKKMTTLNAGKFVDKTIALPVKQLAAGTYWVEIKTDEESKTLQLVIQK